VGLGFTGWGVIWLHNHAYETHEVAWFAAGMMVALTVPISLWEIAEHLHHYSCPEQQKHIVRILWFVPIYAVDSYLAMVYKELAIYINTGRECYEAFVIYSFVNFLISSIGGAPAVEQALLRKSEPMHHMFPFNYMEVWRPEDFLPNIKAGTMSYVVLRLLTTIASLFSEWAGVYKEGEMDSNAAWFWIMIINNFSQIYALYCLVLVYHELHDELEPIRPFGKFMSVKLIVFFSFWQSVAVALLVHYEVIKDNPAWTEYTIDDVATGIQDFLICIEMFLAALAHKWVFSYKDYITDRNSEGANCGSLLTNCVLMFDLSDVGEEAVHHVSDVVDGGVGAAATGIHTVGSGVMDGVGLVAHGVDMVVVEPVKHLGGSIGGALGLRHSSQKQESEVEALTRDFEDSSIDTEFDSERDGERRPLARGPR